MSLLSTPSTPATTPSTGNTTESHYNLDYKAGLDGKMPDFSPSQAYAFKALSEWLEYGAYEPIVLTGAAGTGKTFLLRYFFESNLHRIDPVITAPTHPATRVLLNNIGADERMPVMTTQAAFTLIMQSNAEEKHLKMVNPQAMEQYSLLSVDESSIVNSSLFKVIEQYEGKKLFSGHISQLPAVEDNGVERETGIVFEQEYRTLYLREPMRNPGELALYCAKLEENIYNGKTRPLPYGRGSSKLPSLLEEQGEGLSNGSTQLLAYTNARVEELNREVRRVLYGASAPLIVPGDKMLTPDYAFILDAPMAAGKGGFALPPGLSAPHRRLAGNTRFTVRQVEGERTLYGMRCLVVCVATDDYHNGLPRVGYIHIPQNLSEFYATCTTFKNAALRSPAGKAREKAWIRYHHFQELFPFARHCYAATVHTAQGRSIPSVIADFRNIDTCRNEVIRKKLAYVAASRASSRLITLY